MFSLEFAKAREKTKYIAMWRQIFFVTVIGAVCGAVDHLQMHSLHEPMLAEYWENGLHYWAFGSGSVVSDKYVRLTTPSASASGYLWNRHPNRMESFEITAVVRLRKKTSSWFADTTHEGLALWYTAAAPRHSLTSFYGNTETFDGLGVVLDHSNTLSILINGGETIVSLRRSRQGHCSVNAVEGKRIRIQILYDANEKRLTVYNAPWQDERKEHPLILCALLDDIVLPPRNYFGITALNSKDSQAEHDVESIVVKPLLDDLYDAQADENNVLHLFDRAREKQLQQEWENNFDDSPPAKDQSHGED